MKIVAKKTTPAVSVVVEKGVMIATASLRIPRGYEHVLGGYRCKGDQILRCKREKDRHVVLWEELLDNETPILPEDRIIRKKRQGVVKVRRD